MGDVDDHQADLTTDIDDATLAAELTRRAAELAARRPRVLENTMNRDRMREQIEQAKAAGIDPGFSPDDPMDDGNPMGLPQSEIHHAVDVTEVIDVKRAALACYASQGDVQEMLQMPREIFAAAFGVEHYAEPGRPEGMGSALPFV